MNTFSPGPWGIGDGDEVYSIAAYCSVAMVCLHNEGKANARLIAAAPDLFDALQTALHALDGIMDRGTAMDKGLAALAKARGEPSP